MILICIFREVLLFHSRIPMKVKSPALHFVKDRQIDRGKVFNQLNRWFCFITTPRVLDLPHWTPRSRSTCSNYTCCCCYCPIYESLVFSLSFGYSRTTYNRTRKLPRLHKCHHFSQIPGFTENASALLTWQIRVVFSAYPPYSHSITICLLA